MDFTKYFATRLRSMVTPQSQPIPGAGQVRNSATGYAWAVDRWTQLDRFLILGSDDGTYYVSERELTQQNALAVFHCLEDNGVRLVQRVREVSESGRAPRNDPALFALAMAAASKDPATRAAVWEALPHVARTATHLFHWLHYLPAFRGWGRGVRTAVSKWYTAKDQRDLAYQMLKYQSRDGWSHRDALRLAHPKATSVAQALLFRYATRGLEGARESEGAATLDVMATIEAVHRLREQSPADAAQTIAQHGLTREMVPSVLLRHAVVWEALLERMPLGALVRNLGVMSKVGLLAPMNAAVEQVRSRLENVAALHAARIHPLAILSALRTYAQGHGVRGTNSWQPVPQVVDALDRAFYHAFANAPTTGKRVMLALDVSGSMGANVLGLSHLTCREASAAMAMVTAATEPQHMLTAFTRGTYPSRWGGTLGSGLEVLTLSPRERLDDVLRRTAAIPFGGTDCALPMVEALKHRWKVDLFVIYTDNETWAGNIHPAQALRQYRSRMGIDAKLVVVGMASNGFSIADPADSGTLDVVGFDAAVPQVIAQFAG